MYTEVTLEKLENRPDGTVQTGISDYRELFNDLNVSDEQHSTKEKNQVKVSKIPTPKTKGMRKKG